VNLSLLREHIEKYRSNTKANPGKYNEELTERMALTAYYQSWTVDRLLQMTAEDLYEYLARLWAMLIWGNKQYAVGKLIEDNGLESIKNGLAELVWGSGEIEKRWDDFRGQMKGFGPAMMSEILCKSRPTEYIIWNRRAYVGLNYLGVKNLPRYNYQLTGKKYLELSQVEKTIAIELQKAGVGEANLLTVDYFIWDELQVEDTLAGIFTKKKPEDLPPIEKTDTTTSTFIHNEIRDKLADVGSWLGFKSQIEVKVSDGSKVDTIWESTIGNMGRVIYVFEVQTKGSIDSLLVNLLKALNNPAVQGVVAVSDAEQLEKIHKHAALVGELAKKLKYWDYKNVLEIHEALSMVNESINGLGLVPQGF